LPHRNPAGRRVVGLQQADQCIQMGGKQILATQVQHDALADLVALVYRFTFPYLWLADRMDVKAVRPRATARPSHEACNQPPQYIRNPLVSRRFVDKSGAVFVLRPERTQRT